MHPSPRQVFRLIPRLAILLAVGASGLALADVGRWTPLGPEGGRATSFASAAGGAIVAATDGAGLFRSTDGGRSWAQVAAVEPGETFRFLRAAGADGARLWAASARALYRSENGGRSFTKATPGFVGPYEILGLATARADRDRLYVATSYGPEASWLFGSRDGGQTWKRLHRVGYLVGLAAAPSNPDVIYLAENRRVLRSNDGGRTFTPLAGIPSSGFLTSGLIDVDERDPDRVAFGVSGGRLAVSSDGGRNLTVTGPESTGCDLTAFLASSEIRSRWLLARSCFVGGYGVGADPHFEKFAGEIWRTEDAGGHWTRVATSDTPAGLASIPNVPEGVLLGVSRLGVLRSEDFGRNFRIANRGLVAAPVCSISPDREREGVLFAGAGLCSPLGNLWDSIGDLGFFRLEEGRLTRTVAGLRDPKVPLSAIAAIEDPDDSTRWFALSGPEIARSETQGRRWYAFSTPSIFAVVTGLLIRSATPQRPRTIFASGWSEYPHHIQAYSLVRSDDEGRNWTRVPELNMVFDRFFGPVTTPAAPDTITIATGGGVLFSSPDGGATWSRLSIYPAGHQRGVAGFAVDPQVPGRLLALGNLDDFGIATSVRRSTNGGASFKKSDRGLPAPLSIRALAFDPERAGLVYLGTSRGVFLSEDGGASWRPLAVPGLTGLLVLALSVDSVDPRTLYAGVAGGGGLYTLTRTDR